MWYTTGYMGEARRVIVVFLILLFVIIGMGVLFSRLSKDKKNKPILGGVLDNIFFSKSLRTTPTPTPVKGNVITIRTDSNQAPAGTAPAGTTKGGNSMVAPANPGQIPATGTPTAVLVFSSVAMSAGVFLKRFSR